MQRLAGFWVGERQRAGEKRDGTAPDIASVLHITEQGQTARGKLHPYLVRAPRVQLHPYKRERL